MRAPDPIGRADVVIGGSDPHVYEHSPGRNNNARSRAACSDLRAIMRGSAYLDILAVPVAGAVHPQFVHIVRKQPAAGGVQPKRSRHGAPGAVLRRKSHRAKGRIAGTERR